MNWERPPLSKFLHTDLIIRFGLEVRYETDTEGDQSPQCYPGVIYVFDEVPSEGMKYPKDWRAQASAQVNFKEPEKLYDAIRNAFVRKLDQVNTTQTSHHSGRES